MEPGFAVYLWASVFFVDALLLIARMFLEPGPLRLSLSLSIPLLLILGALINAIYNRIVTGNIFDAPPPRRRIPRH